MPTNCTESHQLADKEAVDVPLYKSTRTVLALMSAWGYVMFYVLRIDLSLAIVCMVDGDRFNGTPNGTRSPLAGADTRFTGENFAATPGTAETSSSMWNESGEKSRGKENGGACGGAALLINSIKKPGEFRWSKSLQGIILGSFFYGYTVTQVPGGWLASRFGGKKVFGLGLFITALATLLVPLAARSSAYLLIALRVIMGLACGVGFPSTHHLYGLWIPPLQRSRIMSFSYAGTMIGTIIANFASGYICSINFDNGWPLIFYIYGAITLLWCIFWSYFVYDSPLVHPRIDPLEKAYIISKLHRVYDDLEKRKQSSEKKGLDVPWRRIFSSGPVYAIVIGHACNNWANYTILVCAPLYMKDVLEYDIKQNGSLSALPHLFSWMTAVLAGFIADQIITKSILSTTNTRKLFQCSSSFFPAIILTGMGAVTCEHRGLAVALLCVAVSTNILCRVGFMVNHVDLSPRYAGILFGISNTVATIPGILAPLAVGFLTTNGTQQEWQRVFYICSGMYIFSTFVYLLLASGELQPWAFNENKKTDVDKDSKSTKL